MFFRPYYFDKSIFLDMQIFVRSYTMKRYTFMALFGLPLLFSTALVHGQGFTGPGANLPSFGPGSNPPPPHGPGHNPPPPPPGHYPPPDSGEQPVMTSRPVTISEAKNYPHDSWVVIAGNIVNVLPGGRHFMFRDSSGEIAVEIGPKEWRGLSAGESDRVEISGEVKIERGQIFIKVHAINAANGTNARRYAVTANEARSSSHDSWAVLTGTIVYSLPAPHDFTFRDSSGEITIDIGPKEWRGLSVGESDRVEICGEVKLHRGQVSIKVHAIRKI
jgi:uncharacterized protein (TIGR00156 family)